MTRPCLAGTPRRGMLRSGRMLLVARLLCLAGLVLGGCSGAEPTVVDGACTATPRYPSAIGCAYVFGRVTDVAGAALDSIDGLIRLGDACACSSPPIEGDANGVYATVVHRLPRTSGFSDTATATIVALASAPKYPRHVTGAAYFDTARVVLRFAKLGSTPSPTEVNLRITIPPR